MKSIYYKKLITDRMGLSAAERIVLSQLVYYSICDIDGIWDKETGEFDNVALLDYEEKFPLPYYLYDNKGKFSYGNKIAKATNVSQPIVSTVIRKLVINNEIEHCDIHTNGYFQLQVESGLRGELLIFYSWLIDIFSSGIVYCNRQKLAEMYHVRMEDIRDYIQRLKKQGFIKRDENNNLIINKNGSLSNLYRRGIFPRIRA